MGLMKTNGDTLKYMFGGSGKGNGITFGIRNQRLDDTNRHCVKTLIEVISFFKENRPFLQTFKEKMDLKIDAKDETPKQIRKLKYWRRKIKKVLEMTDDSQSEVKLILGENEEKEDDPELVIEGPPVNLPNIIDQGSPHVPVLVP